MTAYVVYDFEAVVDRDNPPPEGTDPEKVPSVAHLEIVSGAIVALVVDGPRTRVQGPRLLGAPNYGEAAIIRDFTAMVGKHRPVLVSWNGRGFDLPLVIARCVRRGIVAPWLWDRDFEDRYRGTNHVDLQDAVSLRGAAKPSRMAAFASLTGFPGKVGVDGSDVEGLWNDGEAGQQAVRNYNLGDVVSEAAVLLRVLMCRGDIGLEEYQTAGRALLEHVDNDARLTSLRPLINRSRFMMEGDEPPP